MVLLAQARFRDFLVASGPLKWAPQDLQIPIARFPNGVAPQWGGFGEAGKFPRCDARVFAVVAPRERCRLALPELLPVSAQTPGGSFEGAVRTACQAVCLLSRWLGSLLGDAISVPQHVFATSRGLMVRHTGVRAS